MCGIHGPLFMYVEVHDKNNICYPLVVAVFHHYQKTKIKTRGKKGDEYKREQSVWSTYR